MWVTVLITPLISSNFSCWSLYCLSCELTFWLLLHDRQYNDQQEKFEDIKGVIRTVNYMTGNTMTNKKAWRYQRGNQNGNSHDRKYNDQQVTVLITPLISSNFSCWLLYCLSCELPFWLPLWYLQTFLVGHCIACYNDQEEKFEDIKGVIRTVNHMTGNTMTNMKSLKISQE
jgi:hypothetical protein